MAFVININCQATIGALEMLRAFHALSLDVHPALLPGLLWTLVWRPADTPAGASAHGTVFSPFPRDDRLRHGQGRRPSVVPEPRGEEQWHAARGRGHRGAPVSALPPLPGVPVAWSRSPGTRVCLHLGSEIHPVPEGPPGVG